MSAIGIIFSNIHDKNVADITLHRTIASVPFGGRYRLIDFVLSNMVNSGINKIGIITKSNYESLMDHVGSGRDWDLSRKNGGMKIFPPYGKLGSSGLYKGRLDALRNAYSFLEFSKEENVVLADCDIICNIDLKEVIKYHDASGADITSVYIKSREKTSVHTDMLCYDVDKLQNVTDLCFKTDCVEDDNLGMNIWIVKRELLRRLVEESIEKDEQSFVKGVLMDKSRGLLHKGYEYKGYFARIDSLANYMHHNKQMLNKEKRDSLLNVKDRPVFTKVRDSAPTKYGSNAKVTNSLIADGCIIEGTVKDSIIFRGVKVGKNSIIEGSVIMQDTFVGENSRLKNMITDKNVVIKDNLELSSHEGMPFCIQKGKIVG